MSAVLSPSQLSALPQLHQAASAKSPESRTSAVPLAPIRCGGVLIRGGGWLSPYEYAEALEDFSWAAEMVLCGRLGGWAFP
jgi:glycine/D-amino acid oxidase-like deaminating enzyme